MSTNKKSKTYLSEDVRSYNYKIYGVKDEEVIIVTTEFEPVMIVQTLLGKRFPVLKNKLYERNENFSEGNIRVSESPKVDKNKSRTSAKEKSISNKVFLTGDEILRLSMQYFELKDDFLIKKNRKRIVVEKKHLIRYGLHLNGVSFEDIGKLMRCDRTTTYNSLNFIRDVSSVEESFRNEVDDYLAFLEVKKLV